MPVMANFQEGRVMLQFVVDLALHNLGSVVIRVGGAADPLHLRIPVIVIAGPVVELDRYGLATSAVDARANDGTFTITLVGNVDGDHVTGQEFLGHLW